MPKPNIHPFPGYSSTTRSLWLVSPPGSDDVQKGISCYRYGFALPCPFLLRGLGQSNFGEYHHAECTGGIP